MDLDDALRHFPFTEWAISPRCAQALYCFCIEREPKTIIDFGSGASTLALACYAENSGAKIVTYDHEERWLSQTRSVLKKAGLDSFVDLRLATIVAQEHHGLRGKGYRIGDAPSDIDFVFVDGPPGNIGRLMTLPSIVSRLAKEWSAWVHDGKRPGETEAVRRWFALPLKFRATLSTEHDKVGVFVLESIS